VITAIDHMTAIVTNHNHAARPFQHRQASIEIVEKRKSKLSNAA